MRVRQRSENLRQVVCRKPQTARVDPTTPLEFVLWVLRQILRQKAYVKASFLINSMVVPKAGFGAVVEIIEFLGLSVPISSTE